VLGVEKGSKIDMVFDPSEFDYLAYEDSLVDDEFINKEYLEKYSNVNDEDLESKVRYDTYKEYGKAIIIPLGFFKLREKEMEGYGHIFRKRKAYFFEAIKLFGGIGIGYAAYQMLN